ncbi:MAG: helix-turn-helix domain-containing protein [Bacilli bacterium]|nr:helix-turn-helix domain-containing protein [Bacilli bacterium]
MKNILYDLRRKHNLTQEDVAKILGIYRSYYTTFETKDIISISMEVINKLAKFYNVSIDYILSNGKTNNQESSVCKIAVLGSIPAGITIDSIEDIVDYEEIPSTMACTGEYFGLKVKGNSMNPIIADGDVVIIKKQEDAESGSICAVLVNGYEATLKQIRKSPDGLTLIPFNKEFKEMSFTNEQIKNFPVKIIGKVVESRRKF